MARGPGSISMLIDSPLQTLARSLAAIPADVRKQVNAATKAAAQPIWTGEVRERAVTKLKQRLLVDTARVGVTSRNVLLRSGGLTFPGRSGDRVTGAAEFAGGEDKQITVTRKGTTYTRRFGAPFGPAYRNGSVVYPSARESIPRFASLWVQTARRTIHEAIEDVK